MAAPTLPILDSDFLFSVLTTPHGVLASDGTVLKLNLAMAELLPPGAAATLLGQPLAALRAAAEAAGAALPTAETWEAGLIAASAGNSQTLMPLLVPPGTPAPHSYWQVMLRLLPQAQAQDQYLLLGLLEVSKQIQNQQAIVQAEQEREQLCFLAENLPQLIWATNAHGEADYTNQRFIDYTGHDVVNMDEAARQNLWVQLIHPDDLPGLNTNWAQALHSKQPFEVTFRLRGTNGEYRWYLAHIMVQLGDDGEVRRWFGACTDVHEQHCTQLRLEAQQQHMQRILDQLPLAITTIEGPDHTFTFLSERAQKLMGPRVKAGRTVAESLPEIAAQDYIQMLDQVLATGQPIVGHEEHSQLLDPATGNPRERYNNFGYLPLAGESGTTAGVLAYSLDVPEEVLARQQTEARQAEAQTKAQTANLRLRHMTESLPSITFISDEHGQVLYLSPQWYAYTGTTPVHNLAEVWATYLHPDDAAPMQTAYAAALANGQPWHNEVRLRRHDGEHRWFMTEAVPELDAEGHLLHRFGYLLDVHDLRERTHELVRSRADFAALADNIAQLAWMADAKGHIFWYNQQWYDYTGTTREAMQGWGWMQVHDPALVEDINQRYLAAIQAAQPWEDTFPLRRHDGEYRWFLSRARPIRDPASGAVLRWFGTNTDVTEQLQLTEELVRREEQFRFLAESVPQIVWTSYGVGGNDYINQRWYDYTGLVPVDANEGANWAAAIHPDDLGPTNQRWQQSVTTGEFFEIEYRFRRHDGVYRWFLGQGRPQRHSDGHILKWFGTCTDIEDQKRVQQELESQNARLMRTNEDLDNFVYTASHDLKQPINNMAGIFEELTRTAYFRDPDAIKLISYFERALGQIFATIDNLGAIVQVQRQQQETPPENVALAPLVAEVINSLQDQVIQTGATFELDFATCPMVFFVRANLQSVFFNLISNSLKYAFPGRPPVIHLRSTPDMVTGRPTLTMQDNGLGIDLERFRPQLFQLFRRFHTHVGGTGMGLYLVNRIVQNHSGRLEVASTVDEGTTFQIYL